MNFFVSISLSDPRGFSFHSQSLETNFENFEDLLKEKVIHFYTSKSLNEIVIRCFYLGSLVGTLEGDVNSCLLKLQTFSQETLIEIKEMISCVESQKIFSKTFD